MIPLDNPVKHKKPPISGWKHLLQHEGDNLPVFIWTRKNIWIPRDDKKNARAIQLGRRSRSKIQSDITEIINPIVEAHKKEKEQIKAEKKNAFKELMMERRKLRQERKQAKEEAQKKLYAKKLKAEKQKVTPPQREKGQLRIDLSRCKDKEVIKKMLNI